jgi:hypothetical protein
VPPGPTKGREREIEGGGRGLMHEIELCERERKGGWGKGNVS